MTRPRSTAGTIEHSRAIVRGRSDSAWREGWAQGHEDGWDDRVDAERGRALYAHLGGIVVGIVSMWAALGLGLIS